ncbi:hypothetical protein BC628DRAFT_1184825 [Trametes gibbosa]|nr:hypothetical protein BC628DRAFT_1184825 [Trametes gibbosa]
MILGHRRHCANIWVLDYLAVHRGSPGAVRRYLAAGRAQRTLSGRAAPGTVFAIDPPISKSAQKSSGIWARRVCGEDSRCVRDFFTCPNGTRPCSLLRGLSAQFPALSIAGGTHRSGSAPPLIYKGRLHPALLSSEHSRLPVPTPPRHSRACAVP